MEDIRAHVRNLEEALLDPAVRHDRSKVDALLAPDFQEFGSSGRVWTRNAILDLLASESYFRPAIEDFHCAMIAEGVALVTYRTMRPMAGSRVSTASLRSSLWTQQNGVWLLRFHQGTRLT
jgi:hypothetical protein